MNRKILSIEPREIGPNLFSLEAGFSIPSKVGIGLDRLGIGFGIEVLIKTSVW